MIVPRFNLGRSGLSLLLEGEIDQRKHNHRANDHDGGVQQDKERSDHQATKHFLRVNLPKKGHWVAKRRPPSSPKIEEQDAQPLHAAGTPQCVCFARAPGGIPALSGPHLRLDGGDYRHAMRPLV